MTQAKVKIYVCIDEHGNYQAIGGSSINDNNQHKAVSIIEEGIKVDDLKTITTSFSVMVDLPNQEP